MRFAQNSSARRRTEMSAPFRAGRHAPKCCTNILPECFMQRVKKKKNNKKQTQHPDGGATYFSALSTPSVVTCGLLLFASSPESLFRRLIGRGELVNSQACRDRSNNNRPSTDPLLLLLLLLFLLLCIIPSLVKKGLEKLASTKIPRATIHKP